MDKFIKQPECLQRILRHFYLREWKLNRNKLIMPIRISLEDQSETSECIKDKYDKKLTRLIPVLSRVMNNDMNTFKIYLDSLMVR